MLQIDNTLISLDLFEKKFVCNLNSCKGECCVEGDSGAPLEDAETKILEDIYPIVEKYMTPEGKLAVAEQGKWVIDSDGDKVTPLVNNRECAYTYKDKNGIVLCAIEKAFLKKEINFQKPVSCHLYPVRITSYEEFDAVNYESNKLCSGAIVNGETLGIPVYKFLKTPLTRKYGKEWFKKLEIAADEFIKHNR